MHPLPPTMKSPRDKRDVSWRGGVLQIHVTRACDKACFGCTQGSNLGGKPVIMTPDQFEQAVLSLDGYFGVIGCFGGNPAMSPYFDDYCRILQKHVPFDQRGLWCNHPRGKGRIMAETFNPRVSNLNVHLDHEAYDEFKRDWPRCMPVGRDSDSRHSPPFVAMQDVIADEEEIWRLIGSCDVNQFWSAMICVFRGELRGFFCELAGAQAMLHQHEPDYPDLGLPVVPGWWDQPMEAFDAQVRHHCFACGIPLRGYGELAIGGKVEQVSKTHEAIYKPKSRDREVQVVTLETELRRAPEVRATDYIGKGK
jgi:hypothetical protein